MEQKEITDLFLNKYGISLNTYISQSNAEDQYPIKRIFERQKDLLSIYCRSFSHSFDYDKLSTRKKDKFNLLVLEQMYYILNNFDFSTLAGFDLGINSMLPLSEITNRFISPLVKEDIKMSNLVYSGLY